MALLVLAYPDLAADDRDWIEGIRARHDPAHGIVRAHVTLVFPVAGMAPGAFVAATERGASGCGAIRFVLRSAVPFRDVTAPRTHVFLVPDEGLGALVRLHDRLYAGALAPELRLDIPAIPHVTVAAKAEAAEAKALADELNAGPFAVAGTIAALDIVAHDGGPVRTLARVPLAATPSPSSSARAARRDRRGV